jgi:hypothetical protein
VRKTFKKLSTLEALTHRKLCPFDFNYPEECQSESDSNDSDDYDVGFVGEGG